MGRRCTAAIVALYTRPGLENIRLHQFTQTSGLELWRQEVLLTLTQLLECEVQGTVLVHVVAPRGKR